MTMSSRILLTCSLFLPMLGVSRISLLASDCNCNNVDDAVDLQPSRLGLELASRQDLGLTPHSVAAADFDGDGDIDLSVAVRHADQVAILRNDGQGTFAEPENLPVTNPASIVAADFDRDGRIDLVSVSSLSSQVFFQQGLEGGGFSAPVRSGSALKGADFIAAADLDGDGDLDLATVNQFSGQVIILMNDGNG